MTVAELISTLQKMPQDAQVWHYQSDKLNEAVESVEHFTMKIGEVVFLGGE